MDQLSKYLIRFYININETFTLWGIQRTHIENSRMARGLLQGYARLFGVVAVLFVIGVLYFRRTGEIKGSLMDSSFGFLVALHWKATSLIQQKGPHIKNERNSCNRITPDNH
ncbi:signal peptidase II [bacterium LRH843]|nr:signal peptidase II [bacterium LRH843]